METELDVTSEQRALGKRPAVGVLSAMANETWAILPDHLRTMVAIALRTNLTPEAIEAHLGERLDNTYDVVIRDGVATIPVEGPMFKRAGLFARISGATSYSDIAPDFFAALDSDEVTAIILSFDSPGGQVAGCSELARMIFDARGRKPIVAYIEGTCASAAYWLAAACDRIVAAPASMSGNIGAVLELTVTDKQDKMLGIENIEIVSSQTPNKRPDPTTAPGRAQFERVVDALAKVFIDDVAQFRGLDAAAVIENYCAQMVYVGADALESGLIDELGSYEGLMAELSGESNGDTLLPDLLRIPADGSTATAASGRPITTPVAENAMSNVARPTGRRGAKAAPPAAEAPAGSGEQPEDPNTPAPGEDDDVEEPETPAPTSASALEAAMASERKRVLDIQALGRPGEEKLIATCVNDPKCTPAMAALKLRQAESAAPRNHLAALQADEEEAPAPAAVAASGEQQRAAIEKVEASIMTAGKHPAPPRDKR